MELRLTDEQKLFRETTQRFIAGSCDLGVVRRLTEKPDGPDAGYLTTAAELGWFSMLVPPERGGGSVTDDGLRDLAIVAEERGRTLQPGRFIGSNVVAQTLARHDLSEHGRTVIEAIVAGEASAAWVMGCGSWSPGTGITAARDGAGYRLSGRVEMVQDAPGSQWLLVTGQADGQPIQFLVDVDSDGASVTPEESLDITQRFGTVAFDRAAVPGSAVVGAAVDDSELQFCTTLVLVVAETVGAADALMALATDYAKVRTAFGRPIGSFQALKHQLADLSLSLEAAKAIAVEAARSVQARAPDCGSLASIAKAWTSEMAVDVAQGCLQVFGGIGYTWEHDLHLYLRRLTVNSLLYGGAQWHRRRIWASQPVTGAVDAP